MLQDQRHSFALALEGVITDARDSDNRLANPRLLCDSFIFSNGQQLLAH